ncbi:unnamed protein product [Lathyrus oleraceus]|uniref:Nodule-specific protein n=1 Tax=Pisum sativum TaxID=3888 RepID=Q9AVA3_PEA|nr:nodule-specific protein [Pisum sativum]
MASILKLYVVFIFLFFFVASNVDGRQACVHDRECKCPGHPVSRCVKGFCRCYTFPAIPSFKGMNKY